MAYALCLRPPAILGRQLKPLAAVHLMALEAFESPLLLDPLKTEPADLLLAIHLCCQEWPLPDFVLDRPRLEREIRAWSKCVGRWDFAEVLAQFTDYLKCYTAAPERTRKPGGSALPAPIGLELATWLLRRLHGMTEERAWNMPVCLALAYKAGSDALDGDQSLLDDEAVAVLDAD